MRVRLSYKILEGGKYNSFYALFLSPGGTEKSFSELLDKLKEVFTVMNMKYKIVVFDESESAFPKDELGEIVQLTDTLGGLGIITIAMFKAKSYPVYARLVVHTIAIIDKETPIVPANELLWLQDCEEDDVSLCEPYDPTSPVVPRYMKVSSLRKAMDFLGACKGAWGVVLPSKNMEIVFYE